MKQNIKYMHTIDGKPGDFLGGQICFASWLRPVKLCDSLDEIRKQQRLSRRWRKEKGFNPDRAEYSHIRVEI